MGVYGYPLKTTPELDSFAERSTVFTQCISTAPHTAPAVWSLMTREYRTAHSVGVPGRPKIIPDQRTLARVLSKNGYVTAAFVSNSILHHRRRFWQGFEMYDDTFTSFTPTGGVIERTAARTNQYVFSWLDSVGNKNFFLWIHYQDPHGPYLPPSKYLRRLPNASNRKYSEGPAVLDVTDNEGKNGIPAYQHVLGQSSPSYYRRNYDGEIAYADEVVGDLLERIDNLGLLENSIVILTADHGEAMGEHNYYFCHGHDLTEELIHIPLIVHVPGVEKRQRVNELVSIIDVAPTILSALGLEDELRGSGKDLMPLINGTGQTLDRDYVIAEDVSNRLCVRTRQSSYIAGADGERLYDLTEDPRELQNLLVQNPHLAGDWRAVLNRYRGEKPTGEIARDAPLNVENLKSLGYIK